MAIGRAERRAAREERIRTEFGSNFETALDLLELFELAWHDTYGEITPPDAVIDDVILLADGSVAGLVRAVRLAVVDWRDARIAADERRSP